MSHRIGMIVLLTAGLAATPYTPARADGRVTNTTKVADSDEATLRAHLKRKGLKVGPIGRTSDRQFSNFTFVIDDGSPSGTPSGAIVVGGKVFLKNASSNKTLGSLLKAGRLLEARTYNVDDVLQLLTYFGAFTKAQQGLQDAVSKQIGVMADTAPPGHQPRLEYGRGAAKLIIHWVPPSRRRHGSAMSLTLQKATLTISSAYSLTWKIETIQAESSHDASDR